MTPRTYFAGQALRSVIDKEGTGLPAESVAELAVRYADALVRRLGLEEAPAPVPTPTPAKKYGTPLIGSPLAHGKCWPSTACGHGLCVPRFLGQQWTDQLAGDVTQVEAFITKALEAVQGPIADDPLTWWRQQWKSRHAGRATATPPTYRKAGGEDWFEECKRVHQGACGLSQARHRHQMAVDAADGGIQ